MLFKWNCIELCNSLALKLIQSLYSVVYLREDDDYIYIVYIAKFVTVWKEYV